MAHKLTELGMKVKMKLLQENMTQQELAKQIGVSHQHLSAVLRGSSALLLEEYLQEWADGKKPDPFIGRNTVKQYDVGDVVTVMYQGRIKTGEITRIDTRIDILRYNVKTCSTKLFMRGDFRE